ncbi:MAG: efflux RND transporter permease subunit [Phycisphaerales bacterium]|nr:efflux RND transporter permease subunit [Phycisphaerales bacterium]
MDPIRLAIRQPVTVTVGVILIILAGIVSFARIPIQLTPNVELMVITVTTFWEGASPEEIEQNVVDKQEERLLSLSGLHEMTSMSQQSLSQIRLEFDTGTNKEAALREVSDKLREVPYYPEGVNEPVIQASDRETRDYIAFAIFSTTDPDFDIETLRDFAVDRIEPILENVPGISEITTFGGVEREVQIRIDPVRLAQYGISPTQFARAIQGTNRNISAGQLADGKLDVRLRTLGQYKTLDEIENTVIAHTDAGLVLLRDVGEAVATFKEPSSFAHSSGEPAMAVAAEREIGSNVMETMDAFKATLARLNAPGGLLDAEARRLGLNGKLVLRQDYDQTTYITNALDLVQNNIWIGGSIAVLVLLVFLRSVRSVSVVVLAIPISVIGAIVAMVMMGRSMNVISLAGMAFAVGMVVDNAIVVLENIFRHIEMGKSPREAAYSGAKEVWGAVLASTLTTIIVFVPILLIQAEAGQLFRDISLAICAAVALSLMVSMTVIPMVAARVLKKRKNGDGNKNGNHRSHIHHRFAEFVGRLIYLVCGSTLLRLGVVLLLTSVSVFGTYKLMPPSDYLPAGNRNLLFGMMLPPPGYNMAQMEMLGERIEQTMRPFWEASELRDDPEAYAQAVAQLPDVPTFDYRTQQPGPNVVPPPIKMYFLVSIEGLMFHGTVADDPRRAVDVLPLLSHATRAEVMPGTIAFGYQIPLFQLGGVTGSAIQLRISGPDLDEIVECATAVYMELVQRYGVTSAVPSPANFNLPGPEIQVLPDLVRLSELGLTTEDLGLAVRAIGDGAIVGEYHIAGEAIDLKIISKDSVGQTTIEGLRDVPLAAPTGHIVPIGSVADVRRLASPQQIARVGRQRAVSFQVTPPEGMALETIISDIETMLEEFRIRGVIPPGVQTSLTGSASKLEAVRSAMLGDGTFIGTMTSSLVLALVVVYLLMCVLFQSFIRPLVIMFSVPLATFGGFAALFVIFIWTASSRYMPTQMLDVLTMLGFVLLIGVVVNNAILIVHQTLNFLRGTADVGDAEFAGDEMTPRRAIAEAVRTRVRPIFMSTFTSVGAMLPLVLMPGSGSELYRGLGSVVVGGLVVSTIFTLLLVPLLLSLVFDVQGLLAQRFTFAHNPQESASS